MRIPVLIATVFLLAFYLFATYMAHGRELFPGQYSQVDPKTRQWFQEQKSPKDGMFCCSVADGVYAEEDIICNSGCHYWTRWRLPGEILTAWQPVPDEVVLRVPNLNSSAVVWYSVKQDGTYIIRCFAPGSGV